MVSTRDMKQQNRRLLTHLDDLGQDLVIDDGMKSARQNVVNNNGPADKKFATNNIDSSAAANEYAVDVWSLATNLTGKSTMEVSIGLEIVEDRI